MNKPIYISSLPVFLQETITEMHQKQKWEPLPLLGKGEFGEVRDLSVVLIPLVIKIHNERLAIAYERDDWAIGDEVPLQALQGLPYVPCLYGYIEGEFCVMEKVEGILLSDFVEQGIPLPSECWVQLQNMACQVYERGWVMQDTHIRHVFWHEERQCIRVIDFGQYMPIEEYVERNGRSSFSQQEATEEVLRQVKASIAYHEDIQRWKNR